MLKLLLKSFTLLFFSSSLCKAGRYPDWFWEELNTQLAAAWHAVLSTILIPLILLAAAFWIGSKIIKKR